MNNGLHHRHLRKRLYRNLEPLPHPSKGIRFLDKLIFVVGILGPLTTLPQLYDIFVYQNASGVSATSWLLACLFSAVWVAYGLAHKERVIILSSGLWVFMQALVGIGALIY